MKISIVIPVFNEAESIKELYSQIKKSLKGQNKYEIIFIDDGSSDNSKKHINDIMDQDSNVRMISFYRNFGKSAALSEGFKYASGAIIITMDADLQDDPNEITNFLAR